MASRLLVTHSGLGIYLGASTAGMGFWSLSNSGGLYEAVTFDSASEVKELTKSWTVVEDIPWHFNVVFIEVDDESQFDGTHVLASIEDLIAAGREHQLGDMVANREAANKEQRT